MLFPRNTAYNLSSEKTSTASVRPNTHRKSWILWQGIHDISINIKLNLHVRRFYSAPAKEEKLSIRLRKRCTGFEPCLSSVTFAPSTLVKGRPDGHSSVRPFDASHDGERRQEGRGGQEVVELAQFTQRRSERDHEVHPPGRMARRRMRSLKTKVLHSASLSLDSLPLFVFVCLSLS